MDVGTATIEDVREASNRGFQIVKSWDHGGKLVEFDGYVHRESDALDMVDGNLYYVPAETPDGLHDWTEIKGSYRYNDRQQRGELYGELVEKTDFLANSRQIPLAVAMDGKKAIAAYLYAVRGWDKDSIAAHMDRAESTVRQYITDYKAGRTA